VTVSLRRATAEDVGFLQELYEHEDVDPFLGARRARGRDELLAEIERSRSEPKRFGLLILDVDGERGGALGYREANERSRIAQLQGLAVHPAFRGRRLADAAARDLQRYLLLELGYHRLELAVYAYNTRAILHAERSGFVREGVKRRAYLRHGEWQDAVQFALLREDLERANTMRGMTRYLHTMYRITDPEKSRAFYEALGLEFRRDMDIVRNGEKEATNYFFGVPGQEEELELTFNHDGRTYDVGTGYGHIALAVDDLAETLDRLKEQGIEAEREPYRVREGGSLLCFVRDPDDYRIELIDRSGR
jgi:lactoylglutathione lyase